MESSYSSSQFIREYPEFPFPEAGGGQTSHVSDGEWYVRDAVILCVDDELNGLKLRQIILESSGYRALIAPSGAEALKIFADKSIDLVVLDYLMPEMKGDAVAERMREMKPHVPIIMLSAYYDLPPKVDLLVDAKLVKGESTQNLLDTVSRMLAEKSTGATGD